MEAWADYWASARVQAVALSVSGPIAFYPTRVPYFHKSTFLEDRDLFGECLASAKKRGLRVFGRMSPDIDYFEPGVLGTHPDWFRRDRNGELQMSAPNIAFTCQLSTFFSDQQPAILRELTTRYDIDGVYMNGWPKMQECYCATCRQIGDPHTERYRSVLLDTVTKRIDTYRTIVTRRNPANFYSCNIEGGMEGIGLDQWQLTRHANWFTADNQARTGMDEPVWQAAQQIKYARALMGTRPVAGITGSYSRSADTMWRQATDVSAEPVCRMAQTAAAGGIVWYHQLGLEQGFSTGDRRWQVPGRDFLSWLATHEAHFRNIRSLANVGVVIPGNTMAHEPEAKGHATDYLQGIYAALIDARIPSDFIHELDLSPERLAAYDLLILPNFKRMSADQAAALEAFVANGGSLLASYQTGLDDEQGHARGEFALAELFGIRKDGDVHVEPAMDLGEFAPVGLQMIGAPHAVSEGFDHTSWIAGPSRTQPIKPVADAPFTVIDSYPVYPPEAVYQRSNPSNRPSLVLREAGAARLAYFAGDVDATYWRLDNSDLGRQLVNTIRWLLHERVPLSVSGEGLMELFAWRTQSGYALHCLNYNGPNAFRGHFRQPIDLGIQRVRWQLPDGEPIRSARLLGSGTDLSFNQEGCVLQLSIPAIGLYEVLALES